VDIACSSLDADTLYVTDGALVYWTEDGGDKWDEVADLSLENALDDAGGTQVITSIDVGYNRDEDPYIFVGTMDAGGNYLGSVFYIAQGAIAGAWTDLEVGAFDVYAVAASPDFADEHELFAVVTNDDPYTAVLNNYARVADWDEVAQLDKDEDLGGGGFEIEGASRFRFPEDFDTDDAYEFFVGVAGVSVKGSVYRVLDDDTFRLGDDDSDIEFDIISLDVVGELAATSMLAGAQDSNEAYVSTDDGEKWDDPDKNPSGDGPTYVVMDADFADSDEALAAVAGDEGAVSMTVDAGSLYNQISLINTRVDSIDSVSFSREYATDETVFLLSSGARENSVWRYAGDWERVFTSTVFDNIDLVQVSPMFPTDNTVFVAQKSDRDPIIWRSTDGGNDWDELNRQPEALTELLVVDDETLIAGTDDEEIWKTENHGRRAWDDYDVDDAGKIVSFSMSPNFADDETLLLGDDDGQIFISEDLGEDWDMVGDALDAGVNAIVAFDYGYADNNFIYAASGDEVDRCEIDTGDDWEDQEWKEFTAAKTELEITAASGLRTSADGTLYAADMDEGAGVWRSLNPTDDMDDVVFEQVTEDLDEDAMLTGLWLTAGTNVLWCRNMEAGAEDEVWTYEDFLATQVELTAPADGWALTDEDEVTLRWAELEGADEYTLEYTDDPEWEEHKIKLTGIDNDYKWIEDLDAGTTYYWRVKVSQGEPLLSRWSDKRSFTTALAKVEVPLEWMPENGAQDVILTPSFGWTRVSKATGYEFELADNSAFTDATKETTPINSLVSPITLNYSTTYYWRVRAIKDTAPVSGWISGAFTTMAKPVEPLPPVEITPTPPAPEIVIPPAPAPITPAWIYVIIAIGAVLVIAVIVLIVRTRRAV